MGGEVVVLRYFHPKTCLESVSQYGLTFLIGAPLTREDCIKFQQTLTPNIFNGYGTSEAFWNTFLRPYDLLEMSGSAGRACTDDDVRVVKIIPDRKAEPDEWAAKDNVEVVGEVIVKAPGKTTYSYFNNEAESEKVFTRAGFTLGTCYVG